jgi:L-iditol 2-dehydrogenase
LAEDISAEDATLLPATATAAHILREAALPTGGRLLVVGLGLVGQIVVLLARHQRAERIAVADPSPTLRAKAEWSGATRVIHVPQESLRDAVLAETGGQGVHAAVALLPDPSWLGEASRALGPRGALLVAADFPPGYVLNIAPAWVRRGEVRIQGVRGYGLRDLRDAVRAVHQGIVNAENLLTKRIAWADLESDAFSAEFWTHATHVVLLGPEA